MPLPYGRETVWVSSSMAANCNPKGIQQPSPRRASSVTDNARLSQFAVQVGHGFNLHELDTRLHQARLVLAKGGIPKYMTGEGTM